MWTRASLLLLAIPITVPLAAQEDNDKGKQVGVEAFYKAYFLDKEKQGDKDATKQALELYQGFLVAHPDHEHAGRAAANCVVLLYANGDVKGAEAFGKKFAKVLEPVEAKDRESGGAFGRMGFGGGRGRGGFGGGRGGERPANPNQEMVDKLMALHESAEDPAKSRIASAVTRLGGAMDLMRARFRNGGGFGGRGGGQGGQGGFGGGRRGGGARKPNIAEMSKEEAAQAVDRFVQSAERTIDRMAQSGQEDEADALEAKLDKLQDLVDEGKLKEAQALLDSINLGGGRGRRGGGGGAGAGGEGGTRRR